MMSKVKVPFLAVARIWSDQAGSNYGKEDKGLANFPFKHQL